MSRSDAKSRWEPGAAHGKHPSLCRALCPTWQEEPGQLFWASAGTNIPSAAGGRADGALERLLPVRCHSPEHGALAGERDDAGASLGQRPNALALFHHPATKIGAIHPLRAERPLAPGVPLVVGRMRMPERLPPWSLRGGTQHPGAGGEPLNPAGSEHGVSAGLSILF